MSLHNSAKKGDIAKIVLMPGDPLRAKYIADNFLDDVICFNEIRNMFGYTGTYKGKRLSVMGSGMGMSSIGIYAYELYTMYDVEQIIRIGSCGSYVDELDLLDVVIADNVYCEGNYALSFSSNDLHLEEANKELVDKLENTAKKLNVKYKRGTILTSEVFDYYVDMSKNLARIPKSVNVIAGEMEAFALFHIAKCLDKKAACLLSVVDSHTKKTLVTANDREYSLNNMIKIALETGYEEL